MKHALVIYNPVSGSKKWRKIPIRIQKILQAAGYEWTWYDTHPKQDLSQLFKQAGLTVSEPNWSSVSGLNHSFSRVVVSGGDGTISEVVQYMVRQRIKTPLVILPQGSGNLLARTLDIPLFNLKQALTIGLSLPGQTLDVMRVNRKYYGIVAVGRGYDAFLMQETTRTLKRKWGLFAYAWVFLKTFFFYRSKPYKLTLDGKRIQVLAKVIIVFNLLPIPYLSIRPDDGLLNLFLLTSKARIQTYTAKNIVIKAKKEFKFEVDGEPRRGKVVNIEVLPKALTIVFKKGALCERTSMKSLRRILSSFAEAFSGVP